MEKLSIVLAVVAMIFSATTQAQLSKNSESSRASSATEQKLEHKIYGTLISFNQNGREIVKVEFDEMIQRISPNKSDSKVCIQIEGHRFNSLGEALIVLSSHGWMPEFGWTSEDNRNGSVTHMLIAKEVKQVQPLYPWKEKEGKGDAKSKPAGKPAGKTR